MLINKNPTPESTKTNLFAEGIIYINTSQWLMAYTVFDSLYEASKEKSVALLYNMALCNFYAKKYKSTISILEEALRFLSFPIHQNQSNKPIPEILLEDEYQNNHYQKALTQSVVNLNKDQIKLRICRLLVDTHFITENWKEIIRLSTLTNMNQCENVYKALEKANQNI